MKITEEKLQNQVTYYDMIKKIKIIKDNFCEAGVCDTLPFSFEKEAELFDSMNLIDYWRHCGVPEDLIQQAIKKVRKNRRGLNGIPNTVKNKNNR